MVVFLSQITLINIEIPAHFPSGSVRTRTRGGAVMPCGFKTRC